MRPSLVRLIALCTPLMLFSVAGPASAQSGSGGGVSVRRQPFVDLRAPMPRLVTQKSYGEGRADGAPPQTVNITIGTPSVTDRHPYWSYDEQDILFASNRADLTGTQVNTPATRFQIFRMSPAGGGMQAITGPLASPALRATASQSEPSFNRAKSLVVCVTVDGQGPDILEINMNASPRTARTLVRGNPDGFVFAEIRRPRFAFSASASQQGSVGIIFAGRLQGATNFNLFTVDTQSGRVARVTDGPADDQNPEPSPDGRVVAFDSNRNDAFGATTKANRDIWVIGTNPRVVDPNVSNAPARRVTDFSAGGAASDNIEPTWSTDKGDSAGIVGGVPMIGFSTTRRDTANDGLANAIGSTRDLYFLRVAIGADTAYPSVFTVFNPSIPSDPVEAATNQAIKLPTSDPTHIYDDRHPTFAQFAANYKVAYHSDRSTHDPRITPPAPPSGPAGQPPDIFTSTIIDLNAPTLVRWNPATGEVVNVTPRQALPGQRVRIQARFVDLESGIRDVYVQIKNPNSAYQPMRSSGSVIGTGWEHKVFIRQNLTTDGQNAIVGVPIEWESEVVNANNTSPGSLSGWYPGRANAWTAVPPRYIASISDAAAFSGGPPDPKWLRMTGSPPDPQTGVRTYSVDWVTPPWGSDYIIDLIVYDNAVDPFRPGRRSNWQIYDNIWGFSTVPFEPQNGILFVSDYASGQKFFNSRYGSGRLASVNHAFWGTESWMTDIHVNLHPTQWLPEDGEGGRVWNVMNTLGVKSYGSSGSMMWATGDGGTDDGVRVGGFPAPVTQRYDIWRILSRGPVPDSVLRHYLPAREQQPADTAAGETAPRNVLVAKACVIWHAPYAGNVFAGPGTLTDPATQAQLSAFLAAGGRLVVNGQDIGWALTLDGAAANVFFTGDLRAQFVADASHGMVGPLSFVNFIFGQLLPGFIASDSYNIPAGAGGYNPIVTDPWQSPNFSITTHHQFPDENVPDEPADDFPSSDANALVGGWPGDGNARTFGSPGVGFPEVVIPTAGAQANLTYGGMANPVIMHYPDVATEVQAGVRTEPLNGQRVVFIPSGFEGWNPQIFDVPPPDEGGPEEDAKALKNRRAQIMHNIVCWMRTGSVFGQVRDVEAGNPMPDVLVRIMATTTGAASFTARTQADGTYRVNGLRPGTYQVSAVRRGFTIQKPSAFTVHGGGVPAELSFRMSRAPDAQLSGRVTQTDGTTPIRGAELTLTDNSDPAGVFTTVTDANGDFRFGNVPAQTTYTLTARAMGFGASIPVNYPVPNPNDPIAGQRDAVVVSGKSYRGFDFQLRSEPGQATGLVVVSNPTSDPNFPADGTPIANAVVTATRGSDVVTTTTAGDGRYTLASLDPGTWGIVASAPGYRPNIAVDVLVVTNATTTVQTIALVGLEPGSLSGLVTRTSDGAPLEGATVEIRDSLGNPVPGIGAITTVPVQTVGGYRFNYRFPSVPAGVSYRVTATLSGFRPGVGTTFPQTPTVNPGAETRNVNFALDAMHTFPGALSMVSAPFGYDPGNPAHWAGTLLDIPVANQVFPTFGFLRWVPDRGEYDIFSRVQDNTARTFQLGRGYFLRYGTNLPLSTGGATVSATAPFRIPLRPGWNMIGNPFPLDSAGVGIDIDWTRVSVQEPGGPEMPYETAVAQGKIASALYTYALGSYVLDFRIATWRGYWVRAYSALDLILDPVNDRVHRAGDTDVSSAVLQGSSGWSLNLRAASGDLRDNYNFVGVSRSAVDGFDRFKVEKPPVIGDRFVHMTIDNPDWGERSGGYGVDIRSASPGARTWQLTVRWANTDAPVTLTWPNAAAVSRNVRLTVTDLATGAVRDLRSSGSYSWQPSETSGARTFRVEAVSATRADTLRITGVVARQTGRAAGVNVSYSLSVPANVEVRVLGGTGRVVRTVTGRSSRAAGLSQVTWDGRSDGGVQMPAGLYQIEVRAQTPDGRQTVRQIAPVIVTR
ncbi:MAG TPA: carboxypeptidase regulatory-like domain-containing protein [Chthonomonadales bacterium]|nr:carboxypeptidase regulatory-like domain-containing protein [Chthonomonadales bacterium]